MNILFLNTYLYGGAATSALRVKESLIESKINVDLLHIKNNKLNLSFYAERLSFLPHEKNKSVRFLYSLGNFGTNITNHPLVRKADILHLHWINQGFLSIDNISQLGKLGKPIVWTLHDMWPFTGGCHYSDACTNFTNSCGNCRFLKSPNTEDLSFKIWNLKKTKLPKNIHFIASSNWLQSIAKSSSLLESYKVDSIPTPIDTNLYFPLSEEEKSNYRKELGIKTNACVILFVATKVIDSRKGFEYFKQALSLLTILEPNTLFEALIVGKHSTQDYNLDVPSHLINSVSDENELVKLYGVADVFVVPSIEDNLPNTVLESLSCGTPVVGFNTGGIPEMVDHLSNGYIAETKNSIDLTRGILNVLSNISTYKINARIKALTYYSYATIAEKHISLYKKLLT